MIKIIKSELELYDCNSFKKILKKFIVQHRDLKYLNYIYYMRNYIYYKYKKGLINKLRLLFFRRKHNKLGIKLNLEIGSAKIGKNIKIYHSNIVINPNAVIGDNCILHGNNCIGNNGKDEQAPRIGNNVEIGYGAVIIGNISIADNVTIGANAIVTKSIEEKGAVIIGYENKNIRRKND